MLTIACCLVVGLGLDLVSGWLAIMWLTFIILSVVTVIFSVALPQLHCLINSSTKQSLQLRNNSFIYLKSAYYPPLFIDR